MIVACWSLFVGRVLWFGVVAFSLSCVTCWCLLFVACCEFVVCWLLLVVRCLAFVARRLSMCVECRLWLRVFSFFWFVDIFVVWRWAVLCVVC